MKWASFSVNGHHTFGIVQDSHVRDIGASSDYATLKSAIAADALDALAEAAANQAAISIDVIEFQPVIPDPDKILCAGINYRSHQQETGRDATDHPTLFTRFAASQVGHGAAMIKPHESDRLDFEGEIALIIGKGGRRISKEDALGHVADVTDSIRKMPWSVILMVTGVTVLIALLEKTGGLDLFTDLLARTSTAESVTGMVAFITGLISVYSSTSGVVLPAFLPTVPGLAERLGADALAIASSMNVGSHLVDLSPVSTIGALCLASAPPTEDGRVLFNRLLAWGMSMTIVGGVVCYLFFGQLP